MSNTVLEASIKSLQSKLRKVPAYDRRGSYQIATRHAKDALYILPRNEEAAMDHYEIAVDAARRCGVVL